MKQRSELERQISAAILQLRMRSPFFAALTLFARIQFTNTIDTAATDGRDIFINEHFWSGLKPKERMGIMVHEVLHAALLHVPRRGPREPLLWNVAADVVVNGMIMAQDGLELPPGCIRDTSLEHLSVEEIYHLIQKESKKYKNYALQDLLLPNGVGAEELREDTALSQYWRFALQQAKTIHEMSGQGVLPAGMQRELANLNPSQLDWRSYLWRYLVQTPTDFQGYDRRFISQKLYLEAMTGETVHVYVGVDTSGSIGEKEMSLFLGEVRGILSAYPHITASLYYIDAACYGPYPLSNADEFPKPVGGGGTDFRPFFEAIEKEHADLNPTLSVYLTDGFGTFPNEAPTLPVLWVLTPGGLDANAIPFGEAVRLIPD